jgi:hypothetical protein
VVFERLSCLDDDRRRPDAPVRGGCDAIGAGKSRGLRGGEREHEWNRVSHSAYPISFNSDFGGGRRGSRSSGD